MNSQFDIIIIGDSKEGNKVLKQIASARPTAKIAFVSRKFKFTTTHDFINVEYVQDEIELIDYQKRLFGAYLKKGDRFYSTHIIIASGLKYEPYKVNGEVVPDVYNVLEKTSRQTKTQPAVVVGNNNEAVKFALEVAKKYKQVYFCTDKIELDTTPANKKKLETTENIVVLPNAIITKAIIKEGTLEKVELSNYSTITCSAIFVKTASSPEVDFIPKNIIKRNENGYLEVTKNQESTLVPKCFAIGNCTETTSKAGILAMVDMILQDF